MRRVLAIGATSAIAGAVLRLMAAKGDSLYLVGRNARQLDAIAADLRIRGADFVGHETMDVNDTAAHGAMIARAEATLDGLDLAFIAHGTLPDQRECEDSAERTLAELATNALSTIALLTPLASRFEARRAGCIAVITSVAGDRGRASNYVYGAAKAALGVFLGGLRQRLHGAGVAVVTIKPGFVDTPMTARFSKGPLWTKPENLAPAILRAIERRKDVIYVPCFWFWIMLAIRALPEAVFKRIKL